MATRKAKYILEAEDRTKLALKKAEKNFSSLSKSIVKSMGPMLGVAAGAGMAKLIDSTLEAADALAKTADKLGLTTDALQELNFAAERSGMTTDQLADSMLAFTKRVGEARQNTGPLVSFLKKYDEQLLKNIQHSKDQEEALGLIADAIKNASSATDRAAIANAAFSRSGIDMVNMLKDGEAGLDDLRDAAIDAGAVLDEGLLRSAEAINDAFGTLAATISTKVKSAILEVAAAVAVVAEHVAALSGTVSMMSLDSLFKEQVNLTRELSAMESSSLNKNPFTGKLFPFYQDQAARLREELSGVNEQIDKLHTRKYPGGSSSGSTSTSIDSGSTGKGTGLSSGPFASTMKNMQRQLAMLETTTQYEKTLWEVQNGRYRSLTENQKQQLLSAASALDAKKQGIATNKELAESDREVLESMDEYATSQEDAAEGWRDLLDPMRDVNEQLSDLKTLFDEGRLTLEDYTAAVAHVEAGMKGMASSAGAAATETAEAMEDATDEMSVFVDEAARNLQDAFADFLFDPFEDGMKGMVLNFAEALRRMASDAIAAALFEKLFGGGAGGANSGFANFIGSFFHDGGIVGQDGTATAVNPLLFAGAPRLHNGTIPGLRSDEVPAILQKGEMVLSRSQLSGAGAQPKTELRVYNMVDQADMANAMAAPMGTKVIMNAIRTNKGMVQQILA